LKCIIIYASIKYALPGLSDFPIISILAKLRRYRFMIVSDI
jgi:hypothetical protein